MATYEPKLQVTTIDTWTRTLGYASDWPGYELLPGDQLVCCKDDGSRAGGEPKDVRITVVSSDGACIQYIEAVGAKDRVAVGDYLLHKHLVEAELRMRRGVGPTQRRFRLR